MAGGIIILPGGKDRTPERGAGLDRDGPPGTAPVCEGYCTTEFHDQAAILLPRRFDNSVGGPPGHPPTVCPKCREFLKAYHEKAQAGEVPVGNRIIPGALTDRSAKPREW